MIEHEPLEVHSRHRLYTTEDHRRQLDGLHEESYGRGFPVNVGLVVVDRSPDWGTRTEAVTYQTELGYYGELKIPKDVREVMDLEPQVGDVVRATLESAE